jgi:chromosome partitioning protein
MLKQNLSSTESPKACGYYHPNCQGLFHMNVIVFASRKGGSGKSTMAVHLAVHANRDSSRCLMIDADVQGSMSLWHKLRRTGDPPLKNGTHAVAEVVMAAKREGYEWAFIDSPPNMSAVVIDAIRCATLVIVPARLTVFDLAAIKETVEAARQERTPYVVVLNAAPPRRDNTESPYVAEGRKAISRVNIPVWGGQITDRATYALSLAYGKGANEFDAQSEAAGEIGRLWSAIERSVKAINGAYEAAAMHRGATCWRERSHCVTGGFR